MRKSILVIFLFGLLSCNSEFKITPIYEDFNNKAEFNTQYFDISGHKNLSYSILLDRIVYFSENELVTKNLIPPKVTIQNFYRKTLYSPCKSYKNIRYEAREGEMGLLRGCSKELLVAYIWYSRASINGDTFIRNTTIFTTFRKNKFLTEQKIVVSREDSIKVIKNKFLLLKKGKNRYTRIIYNKDYLE